ELLRQATVERLLAGGAAAVVAGDLHDDHVVAALDIEVVAIAVELFRGVLVEEDEAVVLGDVEHFAHGEVDAVAQRGEPGRGLAAAKGYADQGHVFLRCFQCSSEGRETWPTRYSCASCAM